MKEINDERVEDSFGLDFQTDIEINPDDLDVEWLDQPQKYFRYGRACAHARDLLDKAKIKRDATRADMELAIRKHSDVFLGDVKVTEGSISAVMSSLLSGEMRERANNNDGVLSKFSCVSEYINANDAYLEANYDLEIMQMAVRAFEQRKNALENLSRLASMEYFSCPTEPRDLGDKYKEKSRERKMRAQKSRTSDGFAQAAENRTTSKKTIKKTIRKKGK